MFLFFSFFPYDKYMLCLVSPSPGRAGLSRCPRRAQAVCLLGEGGSSTNAQRNISEAFWARLARLYNFYLWLPGRKSKKFSRIQSLLLLIHGAGAQERVALFASCETCCSQTLTNGCTFKPNQRSAGVLAGERMLPEKDRAGRQSNAALQA